MSHPIPDFNSVRNKEIEVNLFVGDSRHNYVSHIGKMLCKYPVRSCGNWLSLKNQQTE